MHDKDLCQIIFKSKKESCKIIQIFQILDQKKKGLEGSCDVIYP